MPETPMILDTRPTGHSSFGTLPYLQADDYDLLRAFYKFDWLTTYGYDEAMPGELYLGLYAIELKAGPSIVQPRVFDIDGQPASNVLLWFSWPDAEALDPAVHPRYKETGVFGWTDGTGSCGWAYGSESYLGPNGGPYTVWANSGEGLLGSVVGSDALTNIGWWDEHITPNPWFRVMRKGGDVVEPVGELRLAALDAEGNVLGWTYLTNDVPANSGSFAVLDSLDNVLGSVAWDVG